MAFWHLLRKAEKPKKKIKKCLSWDILHLAEFRNGLLPHACLKRLSRSQIIGCAWCFHAGTMYIVDMGHENCFPPEEAHTYSCCAVICGYYHSDGILFLWKWRVLRQPLVECPIATFSAWMHRNVPQYESFQTHSWHFTQTVDTRRESSASHRRFLCMRCYGRWCLTKYINWCLLCRQLYITPDVNKT